jgi:hypothetical protein
MAEALLREEDGAAVVEQHGERDQEHHGCEDGKAGKRADDVEQTPGKGHYILYTTKYFAVMLRAFSNTQ